MNVPLAISRMVSRFMVFPFLSGIEDRSYSQRLRQARNISRPERPAGCEKRTFFLLNPPFARSHKKRKFGWILRRTQASNSIFSLEFEAPIPFVWKYAFILNCRRCQIGTVQIRESDHRSFYSGAAPSDRLRVIGVFCDNAFSTKGDIPKSSGWPRQFKRRASFHL